MNNYFQYDERLGIAIPELEREWERYSATTRQEILLQWEIIRGRIPDRIAELEKEINMKQRRLENEGDFQKSCQLNSEIAELASIINDLWLWFRKNQDVLEKPHV